jgi:hypothetical protein
MLKPSERTRTQSTQLRIVRCKPAKPTIHAFLSREVVHLVSEMSAIHSENRRYWESGAAATREARGERQRRQDRQEEIRAALEAIYTSEKAAEYPRKKLLLRGGRESRR